jgi:cation:H+ antiporter
MSLIYKHETRAGSGDVTGNIAVALKAKFLVAAGVIIAAGLWLAIIGKAMADFYQWNELYVGVVFVALVTTMPEFAVSFSALRRNSVDMAVGNLLGSNFFNIFILAILDIAFRKGEFFAHISGLNIFPSLLAMILTGIAIVTMRKKPAKKAAFAWDSAIIIAVFLGGHVLLFNLVRSAKW